MSKSCYMQRRLRIFCSLYHRDVVKGSVVVDPMRASMMDMVTFKTTYTRDEQVVLIAKMTIVVMKGGEK